MAGVRRCEVCDASLEGKQASAEVCSDACRKRRDRERAAAEREPKPDGPVVAAVLAQLGEVEGAASSLDGLLAVELARRVEATKSNGLVGLSRELDRRLASATGRALTPEPVEDGPVEPAEDDDFAAARRAREQRIADARARSSAG